MKIMKAIVCVDKNWCIGKDDNLLFHLKDDMKFFKETTWGYGIIMGRKTFESLPKGALPFRLNFVLTKSDKTYQNAISIQNIEQVLSIIPSNNIFLIGGESIYKQFYKCCDEIYVTKVDAIKDGNKFFPNLDELNYKKEVIKQGTSNDLNYTIYKYIRD